MYISDEQQLRDLTFWSMGGLGQSNWGSSILALICIAAALVGMLTMSRALDLFQLGERAAFHAGVEVERTADGGLIEQSLFVNNNNNVNKVTEMF